MVAPSTWLCYDLSMLDEKSEQIISHTGEAAELPITPEIEGIGGQTHHDAQDIRRVISQFNEGETQPAAAGTAIPPGTTPQELDSSQFEKPSILNHPSIQGFFEPEKEKPSTWARLTSRLRARKKDINADRVKLTEGGKRAA